MERLFSSLIVAALSALTWVAYKHPAPFKPISIVVMVAVTLIYLATAIWEFGVSKGYAKMLQFLKPGSYEEAQAEIEKLSVLTGWHALGVFSFNIYMMFLQNLPGILRD